jgi:hypothetical protein
MITIDHFPRNKDRFLRLAEFLKEVLDICGELNISPVLSGSLAVFAYTRDQEMNINDVDLACSETEFPGIMHALEERAMSYKLREWHVLQVLRDDLKVELDSIEYWYKDLRMAYETVQIDSSTVNILGLSSLVEFYKRGMNDRAGKTDEKLKYEALKLKFETLEKTKTNTNR